MHLYNAVDRSYSDQNSIFFTEQEEVRKQEKEKVTTYKSIHSSNPWVRSWFLILNGHTATFQLPLVDDPVVRQKETGSPQLSTYIQSSPSDYQRKTRRKWSPEPLSRPIQRNPRRIKTSYKKSPVWRRIQELKSLPGLPAAVALSLIGTILAIWKKNIFGLKEQKSPNVVYTLYTTVLRS